MTKVTRLTSYIGGLICLSLLGCDANIGGSGSQQADPVVVDFPIAYVQRPVPRDEDNTVIADDWLNPTAFNPGAQLVMKDRASVPALEVVITDGIFTPQDGQTLALYDVKDLAVSPDASTLLFAMRAPEIPDADIQPTWNIWRYTLADGTLERLFSDDGFAEAGNDVAPEFLLDGRIVFSSDRAYRAKTLLIDEGKPAFKALTEDRSEESFAFNLHVVDESGENVTQLTFNQNHDLQPQVLANGDILFMRWDNFDDEQEDREDSDRMRPLSEIHQFARLSLYTIGSDGANLQLYYGYHSQNTGTDATAATRGQTLVAPDGRLLSLLRTTLSSSNGGGLVYIDTAAFVDNEVPVASNAGDSGPAQTTVSALPITTDERVSAGGRYNSAAPLFDDTNRLIVSWSPCLVSGVRIGAYANQDLQLVDAEGNFVGRNGDASSTAVTVTEDELLALPCTNATVSNSELRLPYPQYGIWVYDPDQETQSPVVLGQADTIFTEAVVFQETPVFVTIPDTKTDEQIAMAEQGVGAVHIRSIYDIDGIDSTDDGIAAMADPLQTPVDDRAARFLRVYKAVSWASESVIGDLRNLLGNNNRSRELLGYVPIEPDGSVMFQVPADVAFSFSIVDAKGRRLENEGLHENWLSVGKGEIFECTGCHEDSDTTTPHGRVDAQPESVNVGAIAGVNFPNTQLSDDFGQPFTSLETLPNEGESMAQYYSRMRGIRQPSVNLSFVDEWTANADAAGESFNYDYANLLSNEPPTSLSCVSGWGPLCRIIINYPDHIQPIWDAERRITDSNDIVQEKTCTYCHTGDGQIPAGQLDLRGLVINDDNPVASYDALFEEQLRQIINRDGSLGVPLGERKQQINLKDENGIDVLDENGDPVLVDDYTEDELGNRYPVITNVFCSEGGPDDVGYFLRDDMNEVIFTVTDRVIVDGDVTYTVPNFTLTADGEREDCTRGRFLRAGFANNNLDVLNTFNPDSDNAIVDHLVRTSVVGGEAGETALQSILNDVELKLISEWLDVGGQYYNNPFDVPQD